MRELPNFNINIKEINFDKVSNYFQTSMIVGMCDSEETNIIKLDRTMNFDELKNIIGHNSQLYRKVLEKFQAGASGMYVCPIKNVSGIWKINLNASIDLHDQMPIEAITNHQSVNTDYLVENKNSYEGSVEIFIDSIVDGNIFYRYSLFGGSQSKLLSVKTNTECIIINEVELKLDIDYSLLENKKYYIKLYGQASSITNNDIEHALNMYKEQNLQVDHIQFVGNTNTSQWSLINNILDSFAKNEYRYTFAICEPESIREDETTSEYVERLKELAKLVVTTKVQVVATTAVITNLEGNSYQTNLSGIISGLYAKAKVSESLGKVSSFPISNVERLIPNDINKYTVEIDNMNYTTVRKYFGLDNYYITNSNIMTGESNQGLSAETVRTLNKACNLVRTKGLRYIHANVSQGPNQEKDIILIKETISVPLEKMVSDGELSHFEIDIVDYKNIVEDQSVKVNLTLYLQGILKYINTEISIGIM